MRDRLLEFVDMLRRRGVAISVAESLDAVRAVAVAGVEREPLREALAACLVKDEADRLLYDALFDQHFPLIGPRAHGGRRQREARGGGGGEGTARSMGSGENGEGITRSMGSGEGEQSGRQSARDTADGAVAQPKVQRDAESRDVEVKDERRGTRPPWVGSKVYTGATRARKDAEQTNVQSEDPSVACRRARQALSRKLFREYTPSDVEASDTLVALLARELRGRLARRLRVARRGRLDFRRTQRRAASSGGVPMHLHFRGPRPGRPALVALCDVSGSVAAVSTYLLGLIAPATEFFRSVETFVYVDHLCSASFENGHLIPHATVDFHAASDFGQVLVEYCAGPVNRLDRNAVFLVLGDARNNRRPPRARLLADIRARSRAVYWLNPEPAQRWNTGDSVIAQYARHSTAVVECCNLAMLVEALARALKAVP
jgi:uncharacterized protein with von Willebrand factor type A (vWA) domain